MKAGKNSKDNILLYMKKIMNKYSDMFLVFPHILYPCHKTDNWHTF